MSDPTAPLSRRRFMRHSTAALAGPLIITNNALGQNGRPAPSNRIVMGAIAWWGPVYITILTIVVVLQVALLGCPCMLLSGWLRRQHDPDHEPRWSVTVWLYRRYGAWVGIGVFVFFLLAALGVRALLV